MGEFRLWLHGQLSRLDGARERKIVAFGAMGLLIALNVGPTVLHVMAETIAAVRPEPVVVEETPTRVLIVTAEEPIDSSTATEPTDRPDADTPVFAEAPAVKPETIAFLFPASGAESSGPATIAARVSDEAAVAVLFEIRSAAGELVRTLQAARNTAGAWVALFDGQPGEYVLSARASLDGGRVQSFEERRAFRILAATTPVSTVPSVELIAPSASSYAGAAPLAARIKNAAPTAVVFIVTDSAGNETIVLGNESATGGYWNALFEGAAGSYEVRARATAEDRDLFSLTTKFEIKD